MKKKVFAAVLTTILVLGTTLTATAADSKVITFEGESQKFVTSVGGSAEENGFSGMEPGQERNLNLTLVNEDSQEMKFYMSAAILDNIAEKADKNAVYDFNISKNGVVFFSTVIGGKNGKNISVGEEYLDSNNNILLDTLAKGQQDEIGIALKLDGDSAGDLYMNQEGKIQLVFTASTPEAPAKTTITNTVTKYLQGAGKVVTNTVNTIKTGDSSSIGMIVIAGASLLIIILLLVMRHKKKTEGEQQ